MPEADKPPPDSFISRDDGRRYWQSMAADINAMVGMGSASPSISKVDLQGSRSFLAQLGVGSDPGLRFVASVLEGGAGIGRVTHGILLNVGEQVDVIEPSAKFIETLKGRGGIREIFNVGLEEWYPAQDVKYDLIWNQGCVSHLTDEQLVQYLEKCKTVLRPGNGHIVIKEILSIRGVDVFNDLDSTVTREDRKFLSIFQQAGLQLVQTGIQRGLPKTLLPVKMYALKPGET